MHGGQNKRKKGKNELNKEKSETKNKRNQKWFFFNIN